MRRSVATIGTSLLFKKVSSQALRQGSRERKKAGA